MPLTLRTFSRFMFALAALSFLSACASGPIPTTDPAIFLVRHAEKQKGSDPALTDAGAARADRIAAQLEKAGIEKIYSTDYTRTRDTAAPLAEKLGLEIILYDPRDLPGFADHLNSENLTVLVVGHSNTTPSLVTLLGGEATPIPESEYDRLYCLTGERTVLIVAGGDALTQPGCP